MYGDHKFHGPYQTANISQRKNFARELFMMFWDHLPPQRGGEDQEYLP